ncbi:MAG TPA: 6,7-dimethyl-8-ribityllumazine synthase [Candidatus Sulfotelmatobacter sp.]|jgi:6,7-dimethyl-8-ribityllumazine synthase
MKWVAVTTSAKSEEDFELLTKMLRALGFQADTVEEYKEFRLQMFRPSDLILEIGYRTSPREYPDLELTISDPDSAIQVIKKMGLEVVNDSSGPDPEQSGRDFEVRLPGGTCVGFTGIRLPVPDPSHRSSFEGNLDSAGKTFAIVVARFNSFITERLLAGAVDALRRSRVDTGKGYDIVRVPGAFEIPSAARTLAETGKYDAIICIGCLLRGDTAHYDVIVNEVTRGIGQSAQETGVPHAFGVLTCDTLEQAIDRAGLKMGNKGFEAALAAVEMASLQKAISSQPSAVSKKQVPRFARNDNTLNDNSLKARNDKSKYKSKEGGDTRTPSRKQKRR